MTNEFFMKVVELIIMLILALISAYLIPFIKTKISKDQMEQLIWYVNIAVKAASQMYTKDQWKEKKEYCMKYLKEIIADNFSIQISDEELSALIEGVLNGLKATGELLIKE